MRFTFGNLIHWRRHSGCQEKLKEKLWGQGSLPITTIKMELLLLLAFHNIQGWHHNNWREKGKKGFVIVFIENTLKVISVVKRNYFTYIVKRRKKRNKKHQKRRIYTKNKPRRNNKLILPHLVMHWKELPLLKLSR